MRFTFRHHDSSFSQSSFECRKRRERVGEEETNKTLFNRSIVQFAIKSLSLRNNISRERRDASRCDALRNEARRRILTPRRAVRNWIRERRRAPRSLFVGARSFAPSSPSPHLLRLPHRLFLFLLLSLSLLFPPSPTRFPFSLFMHENSLHRMSTSCDGNDVIWQFWSNESL